MYVYRVARNKFLHDLTGTGSKIHGGRWNSPGVPALYTSASKSLAVLESLTNTPSAILTTDFSIAIIKIAGKISIDHISPDDLPVNWNNYPVPINVVKLGDNWLLNSRALVLKIPSCVIPSEYNYLINPLHADIKKLKITATEKLILDSRISENL